MVEELANLAVSLFLTLSPGENPIQFLKVPIFQVAKQAGETWKYLYQRAGMSPDLSIITG